MSTPGNAVSWSLFKKIKGRDCGTINGYDESSSIRTLMNVNATIFDCFWGADDFLD